MAKKHWEFAGFFLVGNFGFFLGAKLKNFIDLLEVSKKHWVSKTCVLGPLFCLGKLGKTTSYSTGTQFLGSCFWAKWDKLTRFYYIFLIHFTRSNFLVTSFILWVRRKKVCYWSKISLHYLWKYLMPNASYLAKLEGRVQWPKILLLLKKIWLYFDPKPTLKSV